MKIILILILGMFGLFGCQTTKARELIFGEALVFGENITLNFESAQILPTGLLTDNEVIFSKVTNFIKTSNVLDSSDYVLMEFVFYVDSTPENKLVIQDNVHFVIEEDKTYPGFIVKEEWDEGRLKLSFENLNTFSSPYKSKKMRLYFYIPSTIAYSNNLTITETISNTKWIVDNTKFENSWISLKMGDTLQTQDYNLTIKDVIEKPTDPENETFFNYSFQGLEIMIENKTDHKLNLEVLKKTIFGHKDEIASYTAQYLLINTTDIITENDITQEIGTLAPKEIKTFTIGEIGPFARGFFFLANNEIYYLNID